MFTKPLIKQPVTISDFSADMASINRLLAAAAISSHFRSSLLADPGNALKTGFGGEYFPLSQQTQNLLISVQASTLPDFVRKLDEKLPYRLHIS
jgi:hypothetical protein